MKKDQKKVNTDGGTSNLSKSVLDRIDQEKVKPLSYALCVIKNNYFWVFWALSIIIGSLAIAGFIYAELNIGWEWYDETYDNALAFMVSTLPYVWIVLLGVTVISGYFNIRHTKRGYKYSLSFIVIVGVGFSFVGGLLLHASGIGNVIDEEIGSRIPFHRPASLTKQYIFMQPERGLYIGQLVIYSDDETLLRISGIDSEVYDFDTTYLKKFDTYKIQNETFIQVFATKYENVKYACRVFITQRETLRTFRDVLNKRTELLRSFADQNTRDIALFVDNPCVRSERFGRNRN